jgi:DNA-directed RNA polymerase specialized sigma24 family protein
LCGFDDESPGNIHMDREQFQEEEFSPGPETWPDDRTAFMLHCLEEKSKAETAAELGLSLWVFVSA